jgi:ATP-dependent helicase/DNAse subunit B
VLRLESPAELELGMDSRRRGAMLHAALAHAHRALNAARKAPSTPAGFVEEFQRGFIEQLTALAEQYGRDSPLDEALVAIDVQLLGELSAHYLRQHAAYDEKTAQHLRPAHFEVAFGPQREREGDDARDPLSAEAPLVLRAGGEEVHIAGRIDRLDLYVDASDGRVHFGLVDYKSGRPLTGPKLAKAADAGRFLQLDLYTLAAAEVILAHRQAVARYNGYWHVADKKGFHLWQMAHEAAGWEETPAWRERRRRVAEIVLSFVAAIRDGQFPVHSSDEDCTSYCDYARCCRVNQARSLEKQWTPPTVTANANE